MRLIIAVVLGTAATADGVAMAVLAQSSPPLGTWLQAPIVGMVCAAVTAVVLGNAPGGICSPRRRPRRCRCARGLAASCATGAPLLLRLAWGALDRVPARALLDASALAGHVVAASVVLEPGAPTWIAEDPHWRGRIGLARLFGVAPHAVLAARAVLPALLGGAWLALALAGLTLADALPGPLWWAFGPAAAPAPAAGALRMARRRAVDHSMPVVHALVGSLPTGPFLWAVTDIDIAALACSPLLSAVSAPPSATGAYLAAQVLAGPAVLTAFLTTASRKRKPG
ncbi:hypothetical protein [Actinomadura opuntiae]|uniref:hypothetical protein n=1 Tax=Actinomadura sp. OS1-43 TaxID=604315 RepID=UPI00255AC62B|nr:hypothetical protein [Actinomadura sp. OS1-43]MDL4817204.1 hypothetical protein [Actinomadura sp. OS1-43]